jgi:predicted enzyme related to lactoylglutathione lyase
MTAARDLARALEFYRDAMDIDAAERVLREAGIRFFSTAMEMPGSHIAWCDDTEGNNLAIH